MRISDWSSDVCSSDLQAIALANAPHISVIGGAEICALFLSRADRIELTQVHATPPGDTFLDAFDPTAWQETAREDFTAEGGRPAYSFVTLRRSEARRVGEEGVSTCSSGWWPDN